MLSDLMTLRTAAHQALLPVGFSRCYTKCGVPRSSNANSFLKDSKVPVHEDESGKQAKERGN